MLPALCEGLIGMGRWRCPGPECGGVGREATLPVWSQGRTNALKPDIACSTKRDVPVATKSALKNGNEM